VFIQKEQYGKYEDVLGVAMQPVRSAFLLPKVTFKSIDIISMLMVRTFAPEEFFKTGMETS
jgi:hypothetical protein